MHSPATMRRRGNRRQWWTILAVLDSHVECICCLSLLLGGSWVVISGVISPLIKVISIVALLITLLITTREPPSIPH